MEYMAIAHEKTFQPRAVICFYFTL